MLRGDCRRKLYVKQHKDNCRQMRDQAFKSLSELVREGRDRVEESKREIHD